MALALVGFEGERQLPVCRRYAALFLRLVPGWLGVIGRGCLPGGSHSAACEPESEKKRSKKERAQTDLLIRFHMVVVTCYVSASLGDVPLPAFAFSYLILQTSNAS